MLVSRLSAFCVATSIRLLVLVPRMLGTSLMAGFVNLQNTDQEITMNRSLTLGLGILIGAALGAAAVKGLHAQGKTPGAYAILDISEILDPAAVPQIVAKAVPATKAAGGQYLAATEKITALSGDPPKRVAILAFDSVDQAKAWYNLPAQQEVNAMDDKAVKRRWYIVDSAM